MKRLRLRMQGRVQGVGYRYSASREAHRLGVSGWVRNTPAGDVELIAEGTADALDRLVVWCRGGPPGAHVTHVQATWSAATGEFAGFSIRADGEGDS